MNRDDFAAAALTGLMQTLDRLSVFRPENDGELVMRAYAIADKMVRQSTNVRFTDELLEVACAASDTWINEAFTSVPVKFAAQMNRLELATRPLSMRKVRP